MFAIGLAREIEQALDDARGWKDWVSTFLSIA